jgi:hypothetical protein
MDVYHKVLVKLYEISGGKDSVDVDFVTLLKSEGFLPSIEDIREQLSGQSWMTAAPKPNHVRITHWGVMEAKRAQSSGVDTVQVVTKAADKLLAEAKQFIILLEEFVGRPSSGNFDRMNAKLSELNSIASKIKENL